MSSQQLKGEQSTADCHALTYSIAYDFMTLSWEAETNLKIHDCLYFMTRLSEVTIGCFKVFLLEFHMALHAICWEVLNMSEQGFKD